MVDGGEGGNPVKLLLMRVGMNIREWNPAQHIRHTVHRTIHGTTHTTAHTVQHTHLLRRSSKHIVLATVAEPVTISVITIISKSLF